MPTYTYGPAPVLVETTGEFAIGATGVLRATVGGDPVAVTDLNGSAIPSILVGPKGAHQSFKADIPNGVLDFGSVLLPAISLEAQAAALTAVATAQSAASVAAAAVTSANAAQAAAEAAAEVAAHGAWIVIHGSDPDYPRPDVTAPVIWYGTVAPNNADDALDVYQPVISGGNA